MGRRFGRVRFRANLSGSAPGRGRMTPPVTIAGRTARLWREVGERVFVRRFPEFDVNVGLVIGGEAALVVDTRGSERQGRLLTDEIRWMTGTRIIVANTHHHYDHVFGNSAFGPTDIWAHEACAARIKEQSPDAQLALAATMPELGREYMDTRIVVPNKTIKAGATIDLGGRRVDFYHLGRGHTDNDMVVSVGDARTIFAGDLIEQGGPPSFEDAYPMDWSGTLSRLLEIVNGPVVPGHGDVVRKAFIEGQQADMAALSQLATRMRFDGGSVTDAVPLAPFPARVARVALKRAFAQLSGEL